MGNVLLVVFFVIGQPFGTYNDISVVIMSLTMLPLNVPLHQLYRSTTPRLSLLMIIIGISIMLLMAVVGSLEVLQAYRLVRFDEPYRGLGPFGAGIIDFVAITVWLLMTGYLMVTRGRLPHGIVMSIIAATWIGYPIWAIWLGRRLLSGNFLGQ